MKITLRLLILFAVLSGSTALRAGADSPRFNHAALFVRDLKTCADFYREVVGLTVIPEPFHDGRHAWFEIGPRMALHIISGATIVLPKEKRSHLCLTVPSVDAFAARLAKAGVTYEDLAGTKLAVTRRPDGVNQIYFQDPDSNWIEINDAKQ
jgi:lactoylglutathione lyase